MFTLIAPAEAFVHYYVHGASADVSITYLLIRHHAKVNKFMAPSPAWVGYIRD